MSEKVPGKVIYIGSIPYDQTEEQVLDVETASSAVRNLNNYSIGNRSLKCDFSNENSLSGSNGTGNNSGKGNNRSEDTLPPLPPGRSLRPGESYSDAISQTLQSLDPTRLNNLIRDVKQMSQKNPILMEELLAQCPQLSYALVETLLITQKASPEDITQILLGSAIQENQTNGDVPQVQEEEQIDEEKLALIKQVLEISDQELAQLPEDQRASILQIKENAQNGVYGGLI
ncbi:unnamed protein product [Wickerhamomyces anomalus]